VSFASPLWLLALLLIPAAIAVARLARRRRKRYALRFPATGSALLAAAAAAPASRLRQWLPGALLVGALALLAVALARPRVPYRQAVGQASLMLVTDHSGSMAATDVQPTRLAAAQSAADRFLGSLPGTVKVGAVAFGSSPDAVQGPVTDHSAARSVIDGQNADGATDTGDALALAIQLLHGGTRGHPPAAIVLLSDGSANTGTDVLSVSQQAKADGIPIETVALGTPSGVLPAPDPFTAPTPVPPDPALMAQIASVSGGRTFSAQSAGDLSSIYTHLASELATVPRRRVVTGWLVLGAGLLLGLLAAVSVRERSATAAAAGLQLRPRRGV
jgi:Ca-activated chloride channel family protein